MKKTKKDFINLIDKDNKEIEIALPELDADGYYNISNLKLKGKLITNVENLKCEFNELSEIIGKNLKYLYANYNLLTKVTIPKCIYAELENNKLTNIKGSNLEYLFVRKNEMLNICLKNVKYLNIGENFKLRKLNVPKIERLTC